MKIIQVIPGIGDESAGPSYSVPALCKGLQDAGGQVILCVAENKKLKQYEFPVINYPRISFPNSRLGRSPAMLKALCHFCKNTDMILSRLCVGKSRSVLWWIWIIHFGAELLARTDFQVL